MSDTADELVSIVVPAYNEAAGIEQFHYEHLIPALHEHVGERYEVLYVNDGSTDQTLSVLQSVASADPRVRVVALSRNFGKEIATTAGIAFSAGKATIIMDADGQHPPEKIGEFLAAWRSGAQVVVGVRESNQKEGFVKRMGSKAFYRMLNAISDMHTVPRSTDFRLIDQEVRGAFLALQERNRITRGLIDWLGFRREYVSFHSPPRLAGEASYTVAKLAKLALNSFTTLSLRPLFFFGYVGLAITFLSFLAGAFVFVEQYVLGDPLGLKFTGAANLGILVSFLVGLVLVAQSITAVYLAHIHAQTQGRPLFVVNRSASIGEFGPAAGSGEAAA